MTRRRKPWHAYVDREGPGGRAEPVGGVEPPYDDARLERALLWAARMPYAAMWLEVERDPAAELVAFRDQAAQLGYLLANVRREAASTWRFRVELDPTALRQDRLL